MDRMIQTPVAVKWKLVGTENQYVLFTVYANGGFIFSRKYNIDLIQGCNVSLSMQCEEAYNLLMDVDELYAVEFQQVFENFFRHYYIKKIKDSLHE